MNNKSPTGIVYNEDIINQLLSLNVASNRNQVINAMNNVINPNDINEIMDYVNTNADIKKNDNGTGNHKVSTLNKKLKSNVDPKTECLVFGYAHNENKNTPKSIIILIIKFYYNTTIKIVYIKANSDWYSSGPPTFYIGDVDQKSKCFNEFDVQLLDKSVSVEHVCGLNSGVCYVDNFKLPSSVFTANNNLNKNNLYDVVFTAQYGNKQCIGYIIDEPNIWCWQLPSFMKEACGQYLLYSNKYGLISVGDGYNHRNGSNDLTVLKFDYQNEDNNKWADIKIKWNDTDKGRPNLSATFINDDKMICCGGGGIYIKSVHLYDFATNTKVNLPDMNQDRQCCGTCMDQFAHDKVYVCGGSRATQGFEYYDINKNKWMELSNTIGKYQVWPLLWNEQPNIVIAAGAFDRKEFERIDIRENKWEDFVLYDKKNVDELFGTDVDIACDRRLLKV